LLNKNSILTQNREWISISSIPQGRFSFADLRFQLALASHSILPDAVAKTASAISSCNPASDVLTSFFLVSLICLYLRT